VQAVLEGVRAHTAVDDDAGNQAIAERVPKLAQSLEVGPADPLLGFDLERQHAAVVAWRRLLDIDLRSTFCTWMGT